LFMRVSDGPCRRGLLYGPHPINGRKMGAEAPIGDGVVIGGEAQ
jgi:hypothetical protein